MTIYRLTMQIETAGQVTELVRSVCAENVAAAETAELAIVQELDARGSHVIDSVLDIATDFDAILKYKTAFRSMAELLDAAGNYRPSLDVSQEDLLALADAYDAAQAARGDARRAFRYGTPYRAPPTVADVAHGRVYCNQAARIAYVVAVADGLALLEYEMPAGRTFLWEVPASTQWRDLVGDSDARVRIRNISPNRLPKRWAHVFNNLQSV